MDSITEKDWLPVFLSEFHKTHLKSMGFKKVRRTFSRDMGLYREKFNFQGSDSNGISGWRFYLNVGVEFKDLPPENRWSYFPNTHWAARSESLVEHSPKEWMYDLETNKELLAKRLLEVMNIASQVIVSDVKEIREDYLRKIKE